jgi:hypothetical protein
MKFQFHSPKIAFLKKKQKGTASERFVTHKGQNSVRQIKKTVGIALIECNAQSPVDVRADTIHARYHSELAMEAARKMCRSRQKRKTGQEVCHHLRMMLASAGHSEMARKRESGSSAEVQFGLAL